jgi:hypothetical protein
LGVWGSEVKYIIKSYSLLIKNISEVQETITIPDKFLSEQDMPGNHTEQVGTSGFMILWAIYLPEKGSKNETNKIDARIIVQ